MASIESKSMSKIAAYIGRDPETGFSVGIVPGIPGAHTQGETLDELHNNLKEVLELCLAEMETEIPELLLDEVRAQDAVALRCAGGGDER